MQGMKQLTSVLVAVAGAVLLALCLLPDRAAGQEKGADSPPEAARAFNGAVNAQKNGAFDLAADEWQRFLKSYPKDPLAAKAQLYLGMCQLQLKDYAKAADNFTAVIKNYPKFDLLEDTYQNLASAEYALGVAGDKDAYQRAADNFAELVKRFPQSKYAEDAVYFRGEALYAIGKKEDAATAYQQLLKDYPQSGRRADALYALGVTQEELSQFADAGKTYDAFLKDFADNGLAAEVRMRKAETILQAGDFAAAAKIFGEVAAVKDFGPADHALMRQAFALAKQDKYAEAADVYANVATNFAQSPNAPEATIAAGRAYYRAGELDDAAKWLDQSVKAANADSAEAAHWLARIHLRDKQPQKAADVAEKLISTGGDSPYLVHLRMDKADALYDLDGKRSEALDLYAKIAADHPQHELAPQALYNAAFAALDLKQFDAALKYCGDFEKAFPQDRLLPDVKYVAAECQLQLKRYPEAEAAYAVIIEKHSDHPEADLWRVRLGLAQFLQKKYGETVSGLSKVVGTLKVPEQIAEANYLIGASQFFSDKFAEAERALSASLQASSQWRQADETLLLLARSQGKLNQNDAAKKSITQLLNDFPNSALLDQAHYRLAEFSYAADDYKTAVAEYGVVAEKWPDSSFAPYALFGKGWAHLKSKELQPATESFTSLVTKHSGHALAADAQFGRAIARRQSGDFKGAVEDIDAYLKSNPDDEHRADALYEKGLAQVGQNDFAGASTTFESLLKDHPKYAGADKALYELGWALKSMDKHSEAVPVFARIAKEHPESGFAAEAWFHVGEGNYDAKEYSDAAAAYQSSLDKKPGDELAEKAAYKLGWSHFQQKQYADALKSFEQQLAAYPAGPLAADGVFMKAECLFRQDNFKEALPAYQAAAKTKASSPTIEQLTLLHGGQSASQLKDYKSAIALLSQIPEKHPQAAIVPEAHYELGWAKHQSGDAEAALKDYEVAAEQSREHVGARARFMMGEVYFERKEYEPAIREFQRAMFLYGGDNATAETKNWQAKAGYEAGRCSEVQIMGAKDAARTKLIADAKRFYGFVVDKHPQHELAAQSKKQLEKLSKL
jgi:cellulose synthase operon protein C